MKAEIKKLEKSQIEITIQIPSDVLMLHWDAAVKEIQKIAEIDGFRKGHVPETMIVSKFGDMIVLEEAAQIAIKDAYPKILAEHKIDAIDYPEVRITKLAKDNPLELAIIVTVLPEVKLPDYKKVAKGISAVIEEKVTDKEVEDTLGEVRASRAHDAHHESNPDDHSHNHAENLPLPELNDEFAQSVGDFKTLIELKEKIKENLQKEKENRAKDKYRAEILNTIGNSVIIDMPKILVDAEVDRMMAQLEGDVVRFGGTVQDYFVHMKKTEEDMRLEWRVEAERRAKVQMIMNEIAHTEKITSSKEEIDAQVSLIQAQFKDADVTRIEAYVSQMLQNEKVIVLLEK